MNLLSILIPLFFLSLFLTSSAKNETLCPAVKKCLRRLEKGKDCTLLPVPGHLLPPPPPPKGYIVQKVRPGVFTFFDTEHGSIIIYRAATLTLIDFPLGSTSFTATGDYKLIRGIEEVLAGREVSKLRMAYSHRHLDHIGGAQLAYDYITNKFPDILERGVAIIGSDDTLRALLAGGIKTEAPVPNILIGPGRPYSLVVSKNAILSFSILPGHTEEDLVVYLTPSEDGPGLVHWVDFLSAGFPPFIDFGFSINLGTYILSHAELLTFNFTRFSGGHGFGVYSDVLTNFRFTRDVL